MRVRRWSDDQLACAVKESYSYRSVIMKLGLVPAGGNFDQVKIHIERLKLDISHFRGRAWNNQPFGNSIHRNKLAEILVTSSNYQSFKLKKRLFAEGLKNPKCELCGWCKKSADGRIPVELDHINGDRKDNRLANLRVLCPNCHSLQATHRGKNIKVRADVGIGIQD